MSKLKYTLFRILYKPFDYVIGLRETYKNLIVSLSLGGGNRHIFWPYEIKGLNNISMCDNVSIGPGSTIYTTNARVIFHKHVIAGPNLTIISGDHMAVIGRYIDTVTDEEKIPELDQDVTIGSNVWIGCNVTILKGVTIGRGSIIAAGSVVTRSCPPYSLIGGVPAKVIRKVYSDDEIRKHEMLLSQTQ